MSKSKSLVDDVDSCDVVGCCLFILLFCDKSLIAVLIIYETLFDNTNKSCLCHQQKLMWSPVLLGQDFFTSSSLQLNYGFFVLLLTLLLPCQILFLLSKAGHINILQFNDHT